MKDTIKNVVGLFIRATGMFFILREILMRNKVTILLYHNPPKEVLKSHIEFLSKYYTFVTLEQLFEAIRTKNRNILPSKGVVLTIDDGFKENYELLELFKKYKIRPTIYLCSHLINTKRKLWFTINGGDVYELKKMNTSERNKALSKYGYSQEKEYPERQMLNSEEIREMDAFVDFQSHSKFHPVLTNCDDEECWSEMEQSKVALENLLEKKVYHFSYPNGDYKEREIQYAEKCGYLSCRSVDLGWNDIHSDPNCLKAMGIEDDANINTLVGQITGFYGYLRFLRHGEFSGQHPDMV